MSSHPLRHNDQSLFTSKTPHFFKVILQGSIRDGILGIPRRFVRLYGSQLSSPVKLEVPNGTIWHVELTKTGDGRVLLQKGWPEFAEHHLLEHGSFVVFRYQGNDHFRLMIFDKSASEIEYPYSATEEEEEDDDDHISVELCAEVSANKKRKGKPDFPCPLSPKKSRTDSKLEYSSSHISLDNPEGVRGISSRRGLKTEVSSCLQKLTAMEKAYAIQIASAFKTTGNPIFMAFMRPSYVGNKYGMSMPLDFAREFLTMQKCNLTLCISAGKTWHAKYYTNPKYTGLNAHIYAGWRKFVADNHINAGDLCVFELIKHREILMKVHIYPVEENASKACRPQAGKKWPVKYYYNAEHNVPQAKLSGGWREFVEDNHLEVGDSCVFELIKDPDILLKVVINPVVENTSKASRPQAYGSIASRVKSGNLVSDTEPNCQQSSCPPSSRNMEDPTDSVIEILDDSPLNPKNGSVQGKGINMEKEKKSKNSQYSTKELGGGKLNYCAKDDSGKTKMASSTTNEKQKACVGASGSRTSNPSFSVVMRPSYVLSYPFMHIPEEFAKRYLKKNGKMILRVKNGRTWTVEYERIRTNVCIRTAFRGKSWRPFVRDNELKVGDECMFELINENLLEVVIQRKL